MLIQGGKKSAKQVNTKGATASQEGLCAIHLVFGITLMYEHGRQKHQTNVAIKAE